MKSIAKANLQNVSQASSSSSSKPSNETLPELCIYAQCKLKSIEGYNFCYQHIHIAANPKSRVKMCSYKSKEADKCQQVITVPNKENFCVYHSSLKLMEAIQKKDTENVNKNSQYTLIDHINIEEAKSIIESENIKQEPSLSCTNVIANIDDRHRVDIDEDIDDDIDDLSDFNDSISSDFLINENNFNENEYEHALENACVYTPEEILKIFKIKLQKLEYLYKNQLNILNNRMKYDRKVYLLLKKNEIEKYGAKMGKFNIKNQAQSDLLKAAKTYKTHKKMSAYMKEKYEEKMGQQRLRHKCTFVKDNVACDKMIVPLSKFCLHHILNDPNQILFQKCGGDESDCQTPIIESYRSKCQMHISNDLMQNIKSIGTETTCVTASTSSATVSNVKNMDDTDDDDDDSSSESGAPTEATSSTSSSPTIPTAPTQELNDTN